MKDIKERVRDKNPKIRNPAARLPKELVRSAVLEAKEKPRELHEKSSGQSESPTQYGTEKIESVQYRAASVAGKSIGKTTYQGGKKLAGVTYRKIKERKSRQEEAKAAEEAMEQGAESGKKLIKLKPEQAALAKENGKRQVKAAPRVVKVSGLSQEKIKTQASMQKQQMEKSLQAMQKARAAQMARKSAQASAESGKAVLQVTGKGVNVLLVEDNELNMEIAEFVLESAGANVIKAFNGKEALEIFKESKLGEIDIILMDVMMPVMDGLEAARYIRWSNKENARDIPIIAMTANAFTEDRRRVLEAGMNEHLAKPLESEVLIKTIANYCGKVDHFK